RLLNFSQQWEGDAAGGGMDKEDAKDLNLKIQELRDGMAFLKQLMDEMRYEPVVQESLLGVE
ncbi:MAG: hypothetical protein O3B24_09690, partial [Verrucomicrobia bacterium]|nr:hypothetical protein [Verrucomicrobiota bacterium]